MFNLTIHQIRTLQLGGLIQPASDLAEPELSLLEKQAIVDEAMRGLPMNLVECTFHPAPEGLPVLVVTKGWNRISAILEFQADKFPTWDQAGMERWQRGYR